MKFFTILMPILCISSFPFFIRNIICKKDDGIHYHIIECEYPDPRLKTAAIDEFKVKKYSHLVVPNFDLK